ncbi:ABC transporter substrate-binding protein [Leucobacter sp. GX24907]
MTKLQTIVTTVAAVAAATLLLSGCTAGDDSSEGEGKDLVVPELFELLPKDVQESGTLVIATDPQYPPCDFTNDNGEIDGFNHDLLMAMAPRLGVEIKQEAISFDGLLPGVESGRFHGAMECITDNEERQKTVKFVDYAYATKSIITTTENPKRIEENPLSACGLKAGVQTGTEFVEDAAFFTENCEAEGQKALQITNFPTAGDQNTALQSGQIDFAFTNTATGVWQAKTSDGLFEVIPSPLLSRTYVGIVVGSEEEGLSEAMLGALEEIIADGTYEEIMNDWELTDIMLLEPGINLATARPLELPELCGSCDL